MNKQAWMDCAKAQGFESFEIYQSSAKSTQMTWYKGDMDTFVCCVNIRIGEEYQLA